MIDSGGDEYEKLEEEWVDGKSYIRGAESEWQEEESTVENKKRLDNKEEEGKILEGWINRVIDCRNWNWYKFQKMERSQKMERLKVKLNFEDFMVMG